MADKGTRNLKVGVTLNKEQIEAAFKDLKQMIQSTAKSLSISLTQVSRDQVSAASQASREMVAIQKAMITQAAQVNKSMTAGGGFNWLTGGMDAASRSQMANFYREQQKNIKETVSTANTAASGIKGAFFSIGQIMAGAFAVSYLVRFGSQALDAMDKLNKMSQKVGVNTDTLQVYGHMAELAGVDIDSVSRALGIMSKHLLTSELNDEGAYKGLRTLGISAKDVNGTLKPSSELLIEVADKFKNMADGTVKTATAMLLFGRSGKDMIPILNQGGQAIQEMHDRMQRLGILIDEDTIRAATSFNEHLKELGMMVKGLAQHVMGELAPALDGLVTVFLNSDTAGNQLKNTATAIANAIKGIAVSAIGVAATFDVVGTAIGGYASFLNRLTTNPFEAFKNSPALTDIDKKLQHYGELMDAIWGKTAPKETAVPKPEPDLPDMTKAHGGMRVSAAKETALALLAIEKSNLELRLSSLGNSLKLMTMEEKQYYDLKVQYAQEAKDNNEKALTIERDSIIAAYNLEIASGVTTASQRVALEEKKNADLVQVNAKSIENNNNYLKAIDDAETEYERKRRERLNTRFQTEGAIITAQAKRQVEYALWDIEERGKQSQWLYEQFKISSTGYYQSELSSAAELRDIKKAEAEKEFNLWQYQNKSRLDEAIEGDSVYTKEVIERHETMLNTQATTDREYGSKVRETYRKMADDIRNIYDTLGVSGVIGKALENIESEYTNMGKNITDAMNDIASNMANAMGDFFDYTSDGWLKLDKLIINICNDVYKALVKSMIIEPLVGGISGYIKNLVGNPMVNEYMEGFARGGVLTSPVVFPMANGMGLAGEAGYEGVMPLTRTPSGDLGVKATGNGQSNLNVKIELINKSGQQLAAKTGAPKFNAQEIIIPVVIDAIDRDVMGLRTMLGR